MLLVLKSEIGPKDFDGEVEKRDENSCCVFMAILIYCNHGLRTAF